MPRVLQLQLEPTLPPVCSQLLLRARQLDRIESGPRWLRMCCEITDPLGEGQGGLRGRRRQGACPTKVLNGTVIPRQALSGERFEEDRRQDRWRYPPK